MATGWLSVPRAWLESLGEIARFCGMVISHIFTGRVFKYFGESLNQAGILILGSTTVIWGLVFVLGLQCGIEGAYFNRSVGAPAYAGVFAACGSCRPPRCCRTAAPTAACRSPAS